MKKLGVQIILLAAGLLLFCVVWRLCLNNRYTVYLPATVYSPAEGTPQPDESEDLLHFDAPEEAGHGIRLTMQPTELPAKPTTVYYQFPDGSHIGVYRISPRGTVYDVNTGGFTGDTGVLAALTLFFLGVAVLMFLHFRNARGPALYSYAAIYTAGFSLFAGITGLDLLILLVRRLTNPAAHTMYSVYQAVSGAGSSFLFLTSPLILAFAIQMIVSNVALLRHERPRLANVLGILSAVLMLSGAVLGIRLSSRPFSGSEEELRVVNTITNVYCTAYVYFECMLAGSIIGGIRAAKHRPAFDRDYIVILGCRFRKDGTLTPLLKGRCDAAVQFRKDQLAATGKEAVLVPSGGQGPDETMPESHAMANYLLSCGVPEEAIRREDASRSTYENMSFSRRIIDAERENAAVAYATTNYHVFRSGVWARLAGLPAEGIGSRTKWWFWPNAFMRECVGLLKNRLLQEIILLAVMVLFFGALSMLLSL